MPAHERGGGKFLHLEGDGELVAIAGEGFQEAESVGVLGSICLVALRFEHQVAPSEGQPERSQEHQA